MVLNFISCPQEGDSYVRYQTSPHHIAPLFCSVVCRFLQLCFDQIHRPPNWHDFPKFPDLQGSRQPFSWLPSRCDGVGATLLPPTLTRSPRPSAAPPRCCPWAASQGAPQGRLPLSPPQQVSQSSYNSGTLLRPHCQCCYQGDFTQF